MYLIYTFVLSLGIVIYLPYYLLRFRRYWPTLSDRFGFLQIPPLKHTIWVHAVSVGEVKAVERLIEGLRQQFPGRSIVVSTATPTGQLLARQRRDIVDHTIYFPIDLPWCVNRVLDRISPDIVIIAETEIWPNFLRACRAREARVVMINGRISDRSFGRYRLIRRWLRRVFEDYAILGMQSETDRRRIEAIGADPRKVEVFGNLKYDATPSTRGLDPVLAGYLNRSGPLWIAASTMSGEEEFVLEAFRTLRPERPELRLVIAPRHPERCESVATIVRDYGFQVIRRTRLQPDAGSEGILLLDTIGELAAIFQYADAVFVGGTLVPTGGHNVLEPARQGKPIVFGAHMENFREVERMFVDGRAAIQIHGAAELAPAISRVLSEPRYAAELGRNAAALVERNQGATERVLRVLDPIGAAR